ncbi:MAG TPA: hypothetical protein VKE22_14845 [Haliangiales bacterium]|nr:hypothetical protein [Haliangiales bacterium]
MVYRDAEEALRQRRSELLALRRAQAKRVPDATVAIYAHRQARRYAGGTGLGLAALIAVEAVGGGPGLTRLLELAWPIMAGMYLFARVAAEANLRGRLTRFAEPGPDAAFDVDRLERFLPSEVARAEADAIEAPSVAVPLAALCLLLPLSIHLVVASAFFHDGFGEAEFDRWIREGLLYGGHCHVILAAQGWKLGRTLPRGAAILEASEVAGWHAWALTILASMAAAVAFVLVAPFSAFSLAVAGPAVVAATGLVFVPMLFTGAGRRIARERQLLARPEFPDLSTRMEGEA